jgi:nitrate reductase / nitrite oxidoreductase, beta subunit
MGGKWRMLANIFANPDLPEIDDYYEPWDYDYEHLQDAPRSKAMPVARPRSLVSGKRMEKIEWGPNWEEILGTEFAKRSQGLQLRAGAEGHLRPVREHLHDVPAAPVRALPEPGLRGVLPSGAIYKREEDGIVLIDQDKCRGWRMCVSGCPYKKIYYNWKTGKSEKCIFCYPRIEAGQPTVCSETCVGRIRYLGVLLYDADRSRLASVASEKDLYQAQLEIFLDPHDENVMAAARKEGIPDILADRRAAVAGLQDGDGMEDRVAAAPGVPHAADGLVRAAAVADPVRRRGRQDRHERHHPRRRFAAHPGALPRQHADRR